MRPFLKWAGNKYRIISTLQSLLPAGGRLIEPFAGSGAVFLNTDYPRYLLSDANPDLIHLFQHLQTEGITFIDYCRTWFTSENNRADQFYHWRGVFNSTQDTRLKAALFVYLNRHGFNGLCRYNGSGQFNVPFGTYRKPYFPQKEMLFFYTKSQTAIFQRADFISTLKQARKGDVVYCDPPYLPLSETASFTHYSRGGFNQSQQVKLAQYATRLSKKGVIVVISNHDVPESHVLYQTAHTILTIGVSRTINSCIRKRQKVQELIAVFQP